MASTLLSAFVTAADPLDCGQLQSAIAACSHEAPATIAANFAVLQILLRRVQTQLASAVAAAAAGTGSPQAATQALACLATAAALPNAAVRILVVDSVDRCAAALEPVLLQSVTSATSSPFGVVAAATSTSGGRLPPAAVAELSLLVVLTLMRCMKYRLKGADILELLDSSATASGAAPAPAQPAAGPSAFGFGTTVVGAAGVAAACRLLLAVLKSDGVEAAAKANALRCLADLALPKTYLATMAAQAQSKQQQAGASSITAVDLSAFSDRVRVLRDVALREQMLPITWQEASRLVSSVADRAAAAATAPTDAATWEVLVEDFHNAAQAAKAAALLTSNLATFASIAAAPVVAAIAATAPESVATSVAATATAAGSQVSLGVRNVVTMMPAGRITVRTVAWGLLRALALLHGALRAAAPNAEAWDTYVSDVSAVASVCATAGSMLLLAGAHSGAMGGRDATGRSDADVQALQIAALQALGGAAFASTVPISSPGAVEPSTLAACDAFGRLVAGVCALSMCNGFHVAAAQAGSVPSAAFVAEQTLGVIHAPLSSLFAAAAITEAGGCGLDGVMRLLNRSAFVDWNTPVGIAVVELMQKATHVAVSPTSALTLASAAAPLPVLLTPVLSPNIGGALLAPSSAVSRRPAQGRRALGAAASQGAKRATGARLATAKLLRHRRVVAKHAQRSNAAAAAAIARIKAMQERAKKGLQGPTPGAPSPFVVPPPAPLEAPISAVSSPVSAAAPSVPLGSRGAPPAHFCCALSGALLSQPVAIPTSPGKHFELSALQKIVDRVGRVDPLTYATYNCELVVDAALAAEIQQWRVHGVLARAATAANEEEAVAAAVKQQQQQQEDGLDEDEDDDEDDSDLDAEDDEDEYFF